MTDGEPLVSSAALPSPSPTCRGERGGRRTGRLQRFRQGDVAIFGIGDEQWRASPDERLRLQALSMGQGTVAILLSSEASPSISVFETKAFYELAGRVVDTFRF